MKLKVWLNEWLSKYVLHYVKYKTYWLYENYCRIHIIPFLGEQTISSLSLGVLQEFISHLMTEGNQKTHKGLAASTVYGIVQVLHSSLLQAKKLNLIQTCELDNVIMPEFAEKQVECFDKEEQERIEEFILKSSKGNYSGILICLYTGLRLGELLALTPQDIDLKRRLLYVTKTVSYIKKDGKFEYHVNKPKTRSSERVIPLSNYMVSVLRMQLKRSRGRPFLFSTKSGKMITNRSYQKSFELILKKLNLRHRGFHSLRHTFATRAIESGMDFKSLSEILGHENPVLTAKRYSHSLLSHKLEMLDKMTRHCKKKKYI